jgi:DNA repair protein RadC
MAGFASAIVIAHNHPSGDPHPSSQDVEFTHAMVEAGSVLNIEVLDHLIVTRRSYYSFTQAGRLQLIGAEVGLESKSVGARVGSMR